MRRSPLLASLFALLLVPATAAAEEEDTARISLWIQPGFTVLGLGVAAGAHARVGDLELMAELTGFSAGVEALDHGTVARGLFFSLGPVIRPTGTSRGWFIVPKAFGAILESEVLASDSSRRPNVRGFLAHVGVDGGYEWRWGPVIVVLVAGGSFGYALDATPGLFRPASMAFGDEFWVPTRKGRGFSYGINANVLRLGITF